MVRAEVNLCHKQREDCCQLMGCSFCQDAELLAVNSILDGRLAQSVRVSPAFGGRRSCKKAGSSWATDVRKIEDYGPQAKRAISSVG